MKNSKYVIVFLILIWASFFIWEWFISKWLTIAPNTFIRIDLIIILPSLIITSLYSIHQLIKKHKKQSL